MVPNTRDIVGINYNQENYKLVQLNVFMYTDLCKLYIESREWKIVNSYDKWVEFICVFFARKSNTSFTYIQQENKKGRLWDNDEQTFGFLFSFILIHCIAPCCWDEKCILCANIKESNNLQQFKDVQNIRRPKITCKGLFQTSRPALYVYSP